MPEFIDLTGSGSLKRLGPDSVVLLGVGAIEQHGPHLPLSTDYVVAEATTQAVVAEADSEIDVWRLPTLAFTKSDEHAWSSGTIWLSWDTLMRVLVDIGRSVAKSPARRLVFLNAHGGNSALLQVASRELRREFGLRTFVMPASVAVGGGERAGRDRPEELGLGIHGGYTETSVLLHLRPDLVHMEHAVRSVPDGLAEYRHVGFGKPVSFGWLSDDFGTNGTIGDPTGASAEAGKAHFEAAVAGCVAALREVARFRPS